MKKILSLLPVLLLSIVATGCKGKGKTNTTSSDDFLLGNETFVYKEAEEVPIDVRKEGCEILYINVVNIPADGIKATRWDDYDIKLEVNYSSGLPEQFPFLTKHFPLSSRHYLGEVGHHNINLLVNNITTVVGFDIIKNPDFNGYRCIFKDSRDGQIKYETTVGYYKTATYGGEIPADQEKENDVVNAFVGWDYPLEYVHQDMIYTSHYRDMEKRYYGTNLGAESNPVISTHKQDSSLFTLAYLGRVYAAPINIGETVYHQKGDAAVNDLHFASLNPYSNIWNEANQSIFTNSLNYSFNATAAQYLLGANTSFSNNPTFLSGFESMYEVKSKNIQMEDGNTIKTSIYPSFKMCYDYAESAAGETKNILSNDDTGYYRIALTCTFDVYVSLEFEQLSNNKFRLNGASEFLFSPVENTTCVRRQYSATGVFGNYFNKTINYSNETLLNIAKSLDWGNH